MAAHVRTECAGCGGGLKTVLDLGSSPLADRFPATPEEDGPAYPLRMAACSDCGLAQLLDVVDDNELFGSDYGFHTSGSPALISYYADWASWAMRIFSPKFVIDIGCNDGTLLHGFRAAGCTVLGVDPAAPASVAAAADIEVWRMPLCMETAVAIRQKHPGADLVTAINVAAHVQDPVEFLRAIGDLLADDGNAVIEFQDIDALVAGCQLDHVYHEHRFFYGARTFSELAVKAGLRVRAMLPTPGQGGSLRVILERDAARSALWGTPGLGSMIQLAALQERAERTRGELNRLVWQEAERGIVAGYGATAKSATLLNFCGLDHGVISHIEDATRAKWGRLTPGTLIPIVAPGEQPPPSAYLLLAWNYLGAVLRRERRYLGEGGKFIVPIPVPMVI